MQLEGWKRAAGHAPERVRAGMSALSQSLDVEPALHAFDEDDAAPRRAQPERLQRTVFFRVVPAPRLLDVRKLGHDHPLGFPVTLQSLHLAASHEELAAVPRDGNTLARAGLLITPSRALAFVRRPASAARRSAACTRG